jgi:RHS repeat-associated protein
MLRERTTRGAMTQDVYYDALLRPVFTHNHSVGSSSPTTYTYTNYDASNKPVFQSRPSTSYSVSSGTNTVYDAMGRLQQVDDTETSVIDGRTDYLNDNTVRMTNSRGFVTTTSYLSFSGPSQSRPLSIQSPEGVTTSFSDFTYLLQPQRISQGGVVEQHWYDDTNLCKTSRPDIGKRWFGHNALGEVTWALIGDSGNNACYSSKPNKSRVASYGFDNLGNIKTVTYQDGITPNKVFTYNRNSQPTKLEFGSVVHELNYFDGLIESERTTIDGRVFSLTYLFDEYKQPKSITYPSGKTVSTAYNALGQAISVGNYATNAEYHPNSLLKSHSYGNGATFSQTLNARLIPQDIHDRRGSTNFIDQALAYDDNNNLLSLTDRVNSAYNLSLQYDELDRLAIIQDSYSGSGHIHYDTIGNITVKKVGSRTIDYQYNSLNQLASTSNGHVRSFSYDIVGNVKSNGVHTFDYNLEGNLIKASAGGTHNHYLYDGNGKRVKTQDSLGTSYSFYGQNGKLMYRYADGKHIDYLYLGGKLVARTEAEGSPVASCPNSYVFDSARNECVYSQSAQMQCPSGQQLSGGKCYTALSGTQCRTNSSAQKSCAANTNNRAVWLVDDFYSDEYFYIFKWAGQEIPHNGTDRNASQIHNGFVYWRGSYVREWEEHYEDDWDNTESYYYTEYGACRCDQGQLILQGNATAYCPSGYTYNSSASSCETTSTPTYVCPDGNAQVNGVCGAGSSSTIYIHTDYLGSPVAETNTSGSLLNARMYYQPFGEQIGTKRDEVSYTGHKYDTALDLSYMQARYYDPVIGRFYSNDPVGWTPSNPVMSFNRYLYVNNNPYKYTDPNGEFLNFAVKFVADVALGAALNYAETGSLNLGGAVTDAAVGALNPAKTLQKAKRLAGVMKGGGKNSPCPLSCFVAGTEVLTKDGHKSIEDISVGDLVWAKNVETGLSEWKPVTHTWVVKDKEIYEIGFTSLDGNYQTIEATSSHPFFVLGKGWVNTIDLKLGDKFVDNLGKPIIVELLRKSNRKDIAYNFTVADFHTYFITQESILVHNCGGKVNGNSLASTKEQHLYMIQDADGNIKKIGVSGQPLNKNGSSPRANSQLKQGDTATVLESGIPGRANVLQKEGQVVEGLRKAGERLPDNKRPKV